MARGPWQRTDEGVEDTLELGGTRAEVTCDPRWRRVARHVEGVVGQLLPLLLVVEKQA